MGLGKPGSTQVTSPSWVKGRGKAQGHCRLEKAFCFLKSTPKIMEEKNMLDTSDQYNLLQKKLIVISCIPTYRMRWRRLSFLIVWLFFFLYHLSFLKPYKSHKNKKLHQTRMKSNHQHKTKINWDIGWSLLVVNM